ncbi:MAG: ABC transporter permease [Actinophytocola sp.]|uniref:ABC transporter permease n=1 Tax=Actinophytocola sp. TaxID=1872138 RepID=UPI003D6BA1DE
MTPATMDKRTEGVPGVGRQLTALVRMELLLLRRNLAATVMSVVTPLVVAVLLISGDYDTEGRVARVSGVIGMIAVFCVHHHLTTSYASRRQEMVLKRLRAGLPSGPTILAGAASAAVLIFLAQAVLLIGYGVLVLDMPVPVNPLTMLLAMLLGAAVLAALAAALSAVTRSAEAAMLTTLPTVTIFLLSPGVLLPLGVLPESVESVAAYLPMGPFTEVLRTGWLGHELGGSDPSFVESTLSALPWLAGLAMWLLIAADLTRRCFRWEPRHS